MAAKPSPPPDTNSRLAAARQTREQARAVHTNTTLSFARTTRDWNISRERFESLRQNDPGAELPAADALLRRLTVAQAFAALWSIRESVVNQKRTVEGLRATLAARNDDVTKLTRNRVRQPIRKQRND